MTQGSIQTSEFNRLLQYIEEVTGITVPDTNYRTLTEAVTNRTKAMSATVPQYISILRADPSERERFLNAVTINETYFFRESRHFTIMKDILLPEFSRTGEPVLAWSATCATGEEGISLALILQDFFGGDTGTRFTVYATDLNTAALSHIKEGIYAKNSFREDGREYHHLIDNHSTGIGKARKISADIISGIHVAQKNLFLDTLEDMPDSFHIVFLRNTLIYMKGEKKLALLRRVVSRIRDGGYLFLSSSEMPLVVHPELEIIEKGDIYFFRKKKHLPRSLESSAIKSMSHTKGPALQSGHERWAQTRNTTPQIPSSISVNAVLNAAQILSENRNPDLIKDDAVRVTAELLLYSIHFINTMKLTSARDLLNSIAQHFNTEITLHLQGFIAMLEGERHTAASFFRSALTHNASFWPSMFYLANTIKDYDPLEAAKEFTRCRDTLACSSASRGPQYGFLVEHFSEKYFFDLCDSWIQSLQKVSQHQQSGVQPCR